MPSKEDEYKYMVCTRCVTYNHDCYIRETMEGFVMQRTSFPVVHVIADDASTDNTVKVIREFLDDNFDLNEESVAYEKETDFAFVIFARHKTNRNCFFVVMLLKENHYSQKKPKRPYFSEWTAQAKYHAVCEGDDYWTDPQKLQIQVDFLESHPEYSMCFHAVEDVSPDGSKRLDSRYQKDMELCPIDDFFKVGGGYAPTCSLLYRGSLFEPKPTFFNKTRVSDSPLILTMFLRGKVSFFSRIMGCYRVNVPGSWSQRQKHLGFRQIIEKFKAGRAYWEEVDKYTQGVYSKQIRQRKRHSWLSLGKLLCQFTLNRFAVIKEHHDK